MTASAADEEPPPQHRRVTSEAAAIVQQLLLEQKQQQQQASISPKATGLSSRNLSLFHQISTRQMENNPTTNAMTSFPSEQPTSKQIVPEPSLAETASYLTTLHAQEGAAPGSVREQGIYSQGSAAPQEEESDDAEKHLPQTLQEASPLERVTLVGDLLTKAAALGNTTTTTTTEDTAHPSAPSNHPEQPQPEHAHLIHPASNDVEQGTTTPSSSSNKRTPRRFFFGGLPSHGSKAMKKAYQTSSQEWVSLTSFFKPKGMSVLSTIFYFTIVCLIPVGGVAAFLFYQADNPPTGRCNEDNPDACESSTASISWWLLFLGIRQVIAVLLAQAVQTVWIDFGLLQHAFLVRILGPRITLVFVQAKGWPAILFFWSLWNLVLLYGRDDFSDHWLYKQNTIGLFNQENPAGSVTTAKNFRLTIITAVVVSISVSLKRYWIGLHLGARMYGEFVILWSALDLSLSFDFCTTLSLCLISFSQLDTTND